jgi:hypothetical protein
MTSQAIALGWRERGDDSGVRTTPAESIAIASGEPSAALVAAITESTT